MSVDNTAIKQGDGAARKGFKPIPAWGSRVHVLGYGCLLIAAEISLWPPMVILPAHEVQTLKWAALELDCDAVKWGCRVQ